FGSTSKAEVYYNNSITAKNNIQAWIKLALLAIHKCNAEEERQAVQNVIQLLSTEGMLQTNTASLLNSKHHNDMLMGIASIYLMLGNIFELGFLKQIKDDYPDSALEVALIAWKMSPASYIMDFILHCTKILHIEGELLPELISAIREGLLTDAQILRTAEIAMQYYDLDTANQIISSYSKTK
ncbi:MAG: hypothetical protein Q4F27_06065, partial [Desulfovibrionaceae bacterium]|nr:hypothetical protein [Desulfovibrionaceae bacterium]